MKKTTWPTYRIFFTVSHKKIWLVISICLVMNACVVNNYIQTKRIEIMKPGIFNIPSNVDTVVLINNVSAKFDSVRFLYFNKLQPDTTINIKLLTNSCNEALADFLNKEGYFRKVIDYRDSLSGITLNKLLPENEKLFKETKSDLCISLDHFNFCVRSYRPIDYVANEAILIWSIVFKSDSLSYQYRQKDTLFFESSDLQNLKEEAKRKTIVYSSAEDLGLKFGAKIIPTWVAENRSFYISKNKNLSLATKYVLNNDWLSAARIWNKQTQNKNKRIAAKAKFNMAFACEMEGNIDAATDWLIQSYSTQLRNNNVHKQMCKQYIKTLAIRKKDIERLSQQVRPNFQYN